MALASFISLNSYASSDHSATQSANFDRVMTSIESDVESGKLADRTMEALNVLVNRGAMELIRAGFDNEAHDWINSWKNNLFAQDLGDHEPLIQWLSDYYRWLQKRLSAKVLRLTGLTDILIFNHGIPVAFHVNGWQGDDWDSVEYQKHFVPLSGAIAYWICYAACSASAPPLVGYACGLMSEVPRFAMVKWVGPGLSNRVYKKFRKN